MAEVTIFLMKGEGGGANLGPKEPPPPPLSLTGPAIAGPLNSAIVGPFSLTSHRFSFLFVHFLYYKIFQRFTEL